MDRARQIYLANERERNERREAAKKKKEETKKPANESDFGNGPATRPVITELMRREAEAHAKFIEGTLPPRDRD